MDRKDGLRRWDKLCSKVGRVVFKSGEICLQNGESCLLKWGELFSKSGASCLGAIFMWGELSWSELSLGQVVLIPSKSLPRQFQQTAENQKARRFTVKKPVELRKTTIIWVPDFSHFSGWTAQIVML